MSQGGSLLASKGFRTPPGGSHFPLCINKYHLCQISCLICLPDKSGNFLAFRAEIAQNTVKPAKTGFGMAIIARPRPVFCVFRVKIPRTFWGKYTEQSSRKKLRRKDLNLKRGSTLLTRTIKDLKGRKEGKSLWGTTFGTFIIYGLQSMFLSKIQFFVDNPAFITMITGVLIIVVVMFFPGGFTQMIQMLGAWKRKKKAERRLQAYVHDKT